MNDLDEVITRAREQGVGIMQTICTELEEFEEVRNIAEKYEGVYCSVGVHPNDAGKAKVPTVEDLVSRAQHPKVIGIGETGLDYYYEHTNRIMQKESFLVHIEAARITGLPLIVHSRSADEDTVEILTEEMKKGAFKGLIHCFSSTQYLAEKSIEIGLSISLSGIISFKNATDIQNTVRNLPLNKLLVETDAPFLAPMPHRGKRNEPAFTRYTNKFLADLKEISEEECARITTDNFFKLFDKAKRL